MSDWTDGLPRGFLTAMRSPTLRARRLFRPGLVLFLGLAVLMPAGVVADDDQLPAAVEIRPRITGIAPLSKEVYGYLPYWRIDSGTVDRIQYELVSTIAIFGIGIKADGNLDTNWVGYKEYIGDDVAAITNAAHDKGVRVVPTFQMFDSGSLTKMRAFLGEHDRPEPVHRPGAGPDGGAQGRWRQPGLRADVRRRHALVSGLRLPVPDGDEGALPDRDLGQRDVRRRGQGPDRGPRPARRPPDSS